MMTTNLFVMVNVKQLWTGGSFRNLLLFSRTSWGVGVLKSAVFKLIRMLEWNTKYFPLNLHAGLIFSNFRDAGMGFELRNQIRHCKTVCIKRNLYLINYNRMRTQLQKKIELFLLIRSRTPPISSEFWGWGVWKPQTPLSVLHWTLTGNMLTLTIS